MGVNLLKGEAPDKGFVGPAKANETTESVESSSTNEDEVEPETWRMLKGKHGKNRLEEDGFPEIRDAKNNQQAREALMVFLERTKTVPELHSATTLVFLKKEVEIQELVKDGWATQKAVDLQNEIILEIDQAKVEIGEAPQDGFNTGMNGTTFIQAHQPGISGDRRAVKVTMQDGRVVWIMWRCGNFVTMEKIRLPGGKTDNEHCTNGKRPKDPLNDSDVAQSGKARSHPTPGYKPGDAEEVKKRIDENGGGVTSIEDGHDSANNGGKTPTGSTSGPAGEEKAPTPTTLPVQTPTTGKDIGGTVNP